MSSIIFAFLFLSFLIMSELARSIDQKASKMYPRAAGSVSNFDAYHVQNDSLNIQQT